MPIYNHRWLGEIVYSSIRPTFETKRDRRADLINTVWTETPLAEGANDCSIENAVAGAANNLDASYGAVLPHMHDEVAAAFDVFRTSFVWVLDARCIRFGHLKEPI